MEKDIRIKPWYRGIRHNKEGLTRAKIFGFDCETYRGKIFLMQFCDGKEVELIWVTPQTARAKFYEYLERHCLSHYPMIIYSHNLSFDIPAVFNDINYSKKTIVFQDGDKTVTVYTDRIWFLKISGKKLRVLWVDSAKFFSGKLEKIAKKLNLAHQKLERPKGLGSILFTQDSTDFVNYAREDAWVEYDLGKYIWSLHEEYKIRPSVSIAHMASRIFRHYFLKPGDFIKLPDKQIVDWAIKSYHGGKNGFYVKPGEYKNVTEIDINSAYPYAMSKLPSFLSGYWAKVDKFTPLYVGLYQVWGEIKECKYPLLFKVKQLNGNVITSYELEEGIKTGEIIPERVSGWVWIPAGKRNPLVEFVNHFHQLKEEGEYYWFYKTIMNSLYGKFIQNLEIETDEPDYIAEIKPSGVEIKKVKKTYQAGGLFHPVIASLITAYVRVYLHQLEHCYLALHSATDSIFTQEKVNEVSGLGGYGIVQNGDVLILRNKLYIFFKNGKIIDYALHGFWGRPQLLLRMWKERRWDYTCLKILKVREALIQGKQPLAQVRLKRRLEIFPSVKIKKERNRDCPELWKLGEFFNSHPEVTYDELVMYLGIRPETFMSWHEGKLPNRENREKILTFIGEYDKI